jgi:hypothetical protein
MSNTTIFRHKTNRSNESSLFCTPAPEEIHVLTEGAAAVEACAATQLHVSEMGWQQPVKEGTMPTVCVKRLLQDDLVY